VLAIGDDRRYAEFASGATLMLTLIWALISTLILAQRIPARLRRLWRLAITQA